MILTVSQLRLAKAIGYVSKAVTKNAPLPILSNILLEAKDGSLRLAATDLSIAINCWIEAKIEEEGTISVPAGLFGAYVGALDEGDIALILNTKTMNLNIKSAKAHAGVKGIDGEDYPAMPTLSAMGIDLKNEATIAAVRKAGKVNLIEVPMLDLAKAVDHVSPAAGTDDSRPVLTGMHVRMGANTIALTATDSYRMSFRTTTSTTELLMQSDAIVPAKNLKEAANIAHDAGGAKPMLLAITKSGNQIITLIQGDPTKKDGFEKIEVTSQLIDAKFPDVSAMLPKDYLVRAVVDRKALLKALQRAILFCKDNAHTIKVAITPPDAEEEGYIQITAYSAEVGANIERVPAEIEGDILETHYNAKFVTDYLAQVEEASVIVEGTQPNRPTTIRPIGIEADEATYLIMPISPPAEAPEPQAAKAEKTGKGKKKKA